MDVLFAIIYCRQDMPDVMQVSPEERRKFLIKIALIPKFIQEVRIISGIYKNKILHFRHPDRRVVQLRLLANGLPLNPYLVTVRSYLGCGGVERSSPLTVMAAHRMLS